MENLYGYSHFKTENAQNKESCMEAVCLKKDYTDLQKFKNPKVETNKKMKSFLLFS